MTTAASTPAHATLRLGTPMMVALFTECLLPQITQAGGRWNGANPKGHAELFKDIKVMVRKDGEEVGIDIPLLKNNYNFNDSNWVNEPATLEKLMACVKKANDGKDMTKKDIGAMLLEIKETLKKSQKAAAVSMSKTQAAAAGQSPTPDVVVDAKDNQTIGELNGGHDQTIGGANAAQADADKDAKSNKKPSADKQKAA